MMLNDIIGHFIRSRYVKFNIHLHDIKITIIIKHSYIMQVLTRRFFITSTKYRFRLKRTLNISMLQFYENKIATKHYKPIK